ncbi:phospholipase D-like domain-containing protein [Hydromonas duriensis]|uniref:Putative cardiolipin synthase n=1 Tax=Hydromonas duriensis TaxID=1527608 RepID=A0A4R6YBJ5_9BURK|nr:phospholipase D family protein [Hydromonas duriensis]TDR32969.1 putative cardiolipin synthase [Hydromonas duriensis]
MMLKGVALWACVCVLSGCASVLPEPYTPVFEATRTVDANAPLVQMVRRVQPKAAHVQLAPTQSESMKKKQQSLSMRLEQAVPQVEANASGIYPLADGVQAFAVRNALIKNVTHTLDLQYYSLHTGLSSRLLIRELVKAADRGVRIRILIDDMDTLGRDKEMTVLAAHDNIEVRIFNPIRRFRGTVLSRNLMLVANLSTQHRRMHNKVWLADGVLGITGGRNIGDRYFNANESDNFSDLDVLLSGAVVGQMQRSFDEFWNSNNAIPVELFEKAPQVSTKEDIQKMIFKTNALTRKERVARHPYLSALNEAENHVLPDILPKLLWGGIDFYSDAPTKVTTPPAQKDVRIPNEADVQSSGSAMFDALVSKIQQAKREVIIASPYFLPGDDFIQLLQGLVKKGVAVTLLSNSLESNDVPLVNGPYSRYRKPLLEAGVKIYELKGFPNVGATPQWRHPIFSWKGSRTALHSKAAVIDGEVSYVGSMNLDPRSVVWNTEAGILSRQPDFAKNVRNALLNAMSLDYSYAVILNHKGQLEWRTNENSGGAQSPVEMIQPEPAMNGGRVILRERGNFWRRLQRNIGACLPENFL